MDLADRLDKWCRDQEQELLGLLIQAGVKSTDAEVRGYANRIVTTQALRGEIATQRKAGGDDE